LSGTNSQSFKYDSANETLENTSLGVRVMVLDAEFYKALVSSLTRTFQTGTIVFLYEMGRAYGELLGKRILETRGLRSEYIKRYSSLAIGKFHFPPLESLAAAGTPSNVTIGLRDSFFASALGRTGQPECHIVRGILEGTAEVVFKKEYQCQEVKCLSKGDKYCEFLLLPWTKVGGGLTQSSG
jgi:predicted hydrocarbon binding protein